MGALAPVSPWIPEDDLLLKNAIEAGASLESLAKGAVQFSRKFTVRELQDRWYCLLYDPVISAEAALQMAELERSNPNLPKFGRTGNTKESKSLHGKRKAGRVHACYRALQKKIRNEPFNSMDLSFLVTPNDVSYVGNENESLPGKGILEDDSSNHFCFEESHLDIIHNAFPEILSDTAPAGDGSHDLPAGFHNSLEDSFHMQKDHTQNEVPHIRGNNLTFSGNVGSGVRDLDMQKELENSQLGVECSDFGGNQGFKPLISESGPSFQNLENSSQVHTLREGGEGDSKIRALPGANAKLKLHMVHHESKATTAGTDCYLAELSNSLFNEEEAFMDEDGKDMIDKSYYDGLSLLLSSPNNVSQVPNPAEPKKSVALDDHKDNSDACDSGLGSNKMPVLEGMDVELQPPSAAPALDRYPEIRDGVICCTLNTEDPEIPCNDNIFLSNHIHPLSVSSLARRNFRESSNLMSTSGKSTVAIKERGEGFQQPLLKNQRIPGQSQSFSHKVTEVGKPGVKFEFSNPSNDATHVASRSTGTSFGSSAQMNPVRACTSTHRSIKLEEIKETATMKSSSDKPSTSYDAYKRHLHEFGDDKCEHGVLAAMQHESAENEGVDPTDTANTEMEINCTTLEPDDNLIESDDDIPYYSDIEAMILDMDLDPDDQDVFELEVQRYQNEETKRAIIRLEQAAHSYMQRAMASHGAFAVFYGRNSKHYIKKPEVLLGRSTEDFTVDIDLGREGRGNKISRRQAILRLGQDGSFHLKNLGRFSILMNDKEIDPGQSSILISNCLIEIRGMPFIFEASQTRVNEYLESIQNQKSQVEQS